MRELWDMVQGRFEAVFWRPHRHSILDPRGRVLYNHFYGVKGHNCYDKWLAILDNRNSVVRAYDFTYRPRTSNAIVQKRMATCYGEEREWRPLHWLPWPRRIRRVVRVVFDRPTGERGNEVSVMYWPWMKGEPLESAVGRMEYVVNLEGFNQHG